MAHCLHTKEDWQHLHKHNLSKRQKRILQIVKENGPVRIFDVIKATYPNQELFLQKQVFYVQRTLKALCDMGLIEQNGSFWQPYRRIDVTEL